MANNITFATNLAAFGAQRNIKNTSSMVQSSLSKLSSGLRVPTAKDDAAALAIGSKLRSEVAGLKQASINAGQATSLLQIAEGAMGQVGEILVRMKSLAVQASSGQLSDADRSTLNAEFTALKDEIDRISTDAEFNGTKLVAGSLDLVADINNSPSNQLTAARGFQSIEFDRGVVGIGTEANPNDAVFTFRYDAATKIMTARNMETGAEQSIDIGSTAIAANSVQIVNFNSLGAKVTLNSEFNKATDTGLQALNTSALAGTGLAIETGTIRVTAINPEETADPAVPFNFGALDSLTVTVDATTPGTTNVYTGAFLEMSLNGQTFRSGAVDFSTAGTKTVTFTSTAAGRTDSITIEFNVTGAATAGNISGTATLGQLSSVVQARQTATASSSFDFKVGTGVVASEDTIGFAIDATRTSDLGLTNAAIGSQANADTAIGLVNTAISSLSSARAKVGAVQSRLDFASNNLAVSIENSEAARSALLDVDVAEEITNFTTKQVLLQAGVSMLAQANQLPQNLLELLR